MLLQPSLPRFQFPCNQEPELHIQGLNETSYLTRQTSSRRIVYANTTRDFKTRSEKYNMSSVKPRPLSFKLQYLMDNSRTGGNNKHVVESIRTPFKKGKPLLVPMELKLHISLNCIF